MARTCIRFGITPNEFKQLTVDELTALYEEASE